MTHEPSDASVARAFRNPTLMCKLFGHRWGDPKDHGRGLPYGRKCARCWTWKPHAWFDHIPDRRMDPAEYGVLPEIAADEASQ